MPMFDNKRIIIFDLDGTLIDSIGVWNSVDQRIIEINGGPKIDCDILQKDRDTFLSGNFDSDIYLEYCRFLISKYKLKRVSADELIRKRWEISGVILENEVDFKPYAVDYIKRLKVNGFTMVLATTTTKVQLNVYTTKNKKMLSQLNLIDFLITSFAKKM